MSKKPVLVFSDVHAPFHHSKALDFLQEVYSRYNCGEVVCAGDIVDFHRSSRHTSELDAKSPVQEYQDYLQFADELRGIFPKGTLVLGNHCLIPQRQMKDIGLSLDLLRSKQDLYGLGRGWKIEDHYHLIDFGAKGKVLVEHGVGSNGANGAINTALAKRISFVQGHVHSYGGISWRASHDGAIFGLNTGCLCDDTSLAHRYGRHSKFNGVLGCGIVFSPTDAIFEKMQE